MQLEEQDDCVHHNNNNKRFMKMFIVPVIQLAPPPSIHRPHRTRVGFCAIVEREPNPTSLCAHFSFSSTIYFTDLAMHRSGFNYNYNLLQSYERNQQHIPESSRDHGYDDYEYT